MVVDADLHVKLTDFGMFDIIKPGSFSNKLRGTPSYVAPEISQNCNCTKAVDIWSLGVVLYICLCGSPTPHPLPSRKS